jgi:hypothetical protein
MNVAVLCDQHSVRFGQRASSHTVATRLVETTRLVMAISPPIGNGRFSQGGKRRRGVSESEGCTGKEIIECVLIKSITQSRFCLIERF